MREKKIRIIIADDHQIVIDGLKSLLFDQPQIEIIGEALDGLEVLKLAELMPAHVVIMDVDMPRMDGLEATRQLREKHPCTQVLALTMHSEKAVVNKMLEAGAQGYVLKNVRKDELLEAISKVAAGKRYFSNEVTMAVLAQPEVEQLNGQQHVHLTQRELEILRLVAEGYSNTEIGNKLFISPRTVDTHRTNLMKKLEVRNIAGLIRYAFRQGLME